MKKYIASIHYSLIVLILALFAALNFVAWSFSGIITAAICGTGVNLDEDTMAAATAEGTKLATNIAEEGITLLKNENNALPLKKDASGEIKVNVFGKGGCDTCFVYQGHGSGGGSREPSAQVSLYTALRKAGISINEDLASAYNALTPVRDRGITSNDQNIYEAPQSFYSDDRIEQAKNFSSTAVVVISRCLGEGYDAPLYQNVNGNVNNDRHYLELCVEEEYMLEKVKENFENVIVVLNSTNVMETGFLEDENIDAALTMYAPGNNGVEALGNILNGSVNPSGKTVDTWAYDFSTAATYANAGVNGTHKIAQGGYVDYAESIYVGYYWYETADEEGYWDDVSNAYGTGYDGVVQYPFGYGLSYTDFEWTIEEVSVPTGGTIDKNSEITFSVYVENTGGVAGQDVVELYFSAPYTEGGIEKPSVKLGAFAKTGVLEPGMGELLTLTVDLYQMSSYDVYDRNNNGFMGYEAEKGEYTVSLRTDAHTVATLSSEEKAEFVYTLGQDVRFDTDPVTGNPVTNRFTTYNNTTSGASSTYVEKSLSDDAFAYSIDGSDAGCNIQYMTRADFEKTFPQPTATRELSAEVVQKSYNINAPKVDPADEMPVTGSKETEYTIYDMMGLEYDDPKWEAMVSQLTVKQMASLCMDGGWGTVSIGSIAKPYCAHADGPSGFNTAMSSMESGYATNYPCETLIASTWNWKLAYQFGKSVGVEAEAAGISGWYGPACDIHRSPFSGRNFEYYSEDPYISGVMVSYVVMGAQEKGLYAFVKHFALADTEPERSGKYTWCTEQAFREIYLKPFEYSVKLGDTKAMMTAYNRVGSVRASGSYAMNTEVLRNEWGFEGMVISDYYCGNNAMDEDEFIRSGNDLKLLPGGKASDLDDDSSATAVKALQRSTKNILYAYVETRYIMATAEGLDLSSVIGTKTEVFPWWVIILVALDVAVVGGCAAWGVVVFRKVKKSED